MTNPYDSPTEVEEEPRYVDLAPHRKWVPWGFGVLALVAVYDAMTRDSDADSAFWMTLFAAALCVYQGFRYARRK
jgi:hypothetical protein